MTTRQLSLIRSVYDTKKDSKDALKFVSFILNLTNLMKSSFHDFKNDFYRGIMMIESMGTETDFEITCIIFITLMVQRIKDNNDMKLHYTFLTEKLLPEMWKDREGIEIKRQRKLEYLAKLLDKNERYQEAHIIRIIVKPYLEEMNRKWTNMTAQEKFRSLFS